MTVLGQSLDINKKKEVNADVLSKNPHKNSK